MDFDYMEVAKLFQSAADVMVKLSELEKIENSGEDIQTAMENELGKFMVTMIKIQQLIG